MADVPVTYTGRPIDSSAGTTTNIDFSSDLTLDHESEVPLLTLLGKLKSESTATHSFKFAVGRFAPRRTTCNGGVVAGVVGATATLNVAAGKGVYFVAGDVLEVPDTYNDATHTNQLYVVSVATDALTVRAYDPATYGVCTIDADAIVRKLHSAMVEGSSGRNSQQTVPTVYENYCNSFEDYFDVTRIQAANRQYTGPERTRLREEARKKHALDQEYASFFSKKVADTSTTGKPRYQMSGLISQISTNVLQYGADLSHEELYDFMTQVHNPAYTGGNKRIVLASGDLLGSINKLVNQYLRITPGETKWGPSITEVTFAGKVWQFIEAPVLSEARSGWGVVIHPMFLKKRVLIPTMYEMNVQNPIDKFYKDGFYSVWGLEVRLEEVFGIIKP